MFLSYFYIKYMLSLLLLSLALSVLLPSWSYRFAVFCCCCYQCYCCCCYYCCYYYYCYYYCYYYHSRRQMFQQLHSCINDNDGVAVFHGIMIRSEIWSFTILSYFTVMVYQRWLCHHILLIGWHRSREAEIYFHWDRVIQGKIQMWKST